MRSRRAPHCYRERSDVIMRIVSLKADFSTLERDDAVLSSAALTALVGSRGPRAQTWRVRVLAPLLLVVLVVAPARAAQNPASPSNESQRLVFLLEYIGTDYDMAVRDGRVVNQM